MSDKKIIDFGKESSDKEKNAEEGLEKMQRGALLLIKSINKQVIEDSKNDKNLRLFDKKGIFGIILLIILSSIALIKYIFFG